MAADINNTVIRLQDKPSGNLFQLFVLLYNIGLVLTFSFCPCFQSNGWKENKYKLF